MEKNHKTEIYKTDVTQWGYTIIYKEDSALYYHMRTPIKGDEPNFLFGRIFLEDDGSLYFKNKVYNFQSDEDFLKEVTGEEFKSLPYFEGSLVEILEEFATKKNEVEDEFGEEQLPGF
jgi:hypothetical protein